MISKYNFANFHGTTNYLQPTLETILELMSRQDNHDEQGHIIQDELLIQVLLAIEVNPHDASLILDIIKAYDATDKWYA